MAHLSWATSTSYPLFFVYKRSGGDIVETNANLCTIKVVHILSVAEPWPCCLGRRYSLANNSSVKAGKEKAKKRRRSLGRSFGVRVS